MQKMWKNSEKQCEKCDILTIEGEYMRLEKKIDKYLIE